MSGQLWQNEDNGLLIFGIEWEDGSEPEAKDFNDLMEQASKALDNWKNRNCKTIKQ